MTYRDALQQVAQGADPATVLADLGLEDVSPDALSSALRHFAETAPIEVADALAPFLARTSPVPFEVGDLEPLPEADAILAGGGDITDLLAEIGLNDPASIDVDTAIDTAIDAAESAITDAADVALAEAADIDDADATFGLGEESTDTGDDDALDLLDEVGRADESAERSADLDDGTGDVFSEFEGVDTERLGELLDHIGEAASIDDLEGTDVPLDFDLE